MNARAAAYLTKHSILIGINGVEELFLPLDKVQGFLDLLTPSDVPPEYLQRLYAAQATMVAIITAQAAKPPSTGSDETQDDKKPS